MEIQEMKRRLKAVGCNPTKLCMLAKINRSTFYRWETGTRPNNATMQCLTNALEYIEDNFLDRLLEKPKLWQRTKVSPENEICIELVDELRDASIDGRLNATWWHNVNEGKRSRKSVALLKQTGLISGVADYVFCWANGSGVIEMKTKKGVISPKQHDFEKWCNQQGVKHAYCRSAMEALETLDSWGILKKKQI